MNIEDRA